MGKVCGQGFKMKGEVGNTAHVIVERTHALAANENLFFHS